MIPKARPTVQLVVKLFLPEIWFLHDFSKVGTDRYTDGWQNVKIPAMTVDRPSGSKSTAPFIYIKYIFRALGGQIFWTRNNFVWKVKLPRIADTCFLSFMKIHIYICLAATTKTNNLRRVSLELPDSIVVTHFRLKGIRALIFLSCFLCQRWKSSNFWRNRMYSENPEIRGIYLEKETSWKGSFLNRILMSHQN